MSQGPTGSDIRNDSNPKSSDDLVYLLIHLLKMDCYTNRSEMAMPGSPSQEFEILRGSPLYHKLI